MSLLLLKALISQHERHRVIKDTEMLFNRFSFVLLAYGFAPHPFFNLRGLLRRRQLISQPPSPAPADGSWSQREGDSGGCQEEEGDETRRQKLASRWTSSHVPKQEIECSSSVETYCLIDALQSNSNYSNKWPLHCVLPLRDMHHPRTPNAQRYSEVTT